MAKSLRLLCSLLLVAVISLWSTVTVFAGSAPTIPIAFSAPVVEEDTNTTEEECL